MLEQIIRRAYYLDKHLKAPLLQERLDYLQYSADKGLSRHTLKSIADYLLRIVEFLHLEREEIITSDALEKAATAWGEFKFNHPMKKVFSINGKKKFIWYSIDWLKRINRLEKLPEEKVPLFIRLFCRRHTLRRHIAAPLLEERLQYLQHLNKLGAKECTLRNAAQYLLIVINALNFTTIRKVAIDEIEEIALCWGKNEKVFRRKNTFSKLSVQRFIHHATCWFEILGCLIKKTVPVFPFQKYRDTYLEYVRHEKGFSEETIYARSSLLKDFLINISNHLQVFATVAPVNIDEVLTRKYLRDGYCRRSVQSYASVVRSFLRYAENQQWCIKGIAESVKAPRVYCQETLPSSPHWDDVGKLLNNTHTDHPTDIRDYAILLLLSVYGMRRSEVAGLRLEDMDWKNEQLYLRRAKKSKPQVFPFSQVVGESILRYLQEVRPKDCKLREVFIEMRSPYRALSPGAIFALVNRRLKPLNLPINHNGPHALRHACATHLINEGISLKEISDHLGHQGLETTRIYTKVDLTNLRKVAAQEWRALL
jgi:site-specific recombinase XerD